MKKVISSLIVAFVLLMSAQTFADPSTQSMNAIKSKNWQLAEKSLSQDLKANRNDAITWYFRAQVLNHLQRPDDALKCLDNVQKIDPNFRTSQVADLRQKLTRNSQIVAKSKSTGTPLVTSSSVENKQSQVVRNTAPQTPTVNRDHYTDTVVPKTSVASSTKESSSGGGSFLTVIFGLFILSGIGFIGYLFVSKKRTADDTKKLKETLIGKLVKANKSLSESRDMLELKNQEGSYIYKRMGSLLSEVDSHTRKVKDGGYDTYAIESTLNEVDDIQNRFGNNEYDAPVSRTTVERDSVPVSRPSTPQPTTRSYNQPRNDYRSRNDYDNNNRGNTTIINNGSNNNDLLTTVATTAILSDIMNNHHDTVREREVIREVPTPVYEDREEKDDFSLNDSSNTYNDSSRDDDFSLSNDDNSRDDFSLNSSDDSSSYNDSSDDDDFKL